IKQTNQTINACRQLDIPIIYTRQINRHDNVGLSKGEPITEKGTPFYYSTSEENHEIIDEVAPADTDIVIDKYRWSAFYETSLDFILLMLNLDHFNVGAMVTDDCILTTVWDGYFMDDNEHLVKDMITTSNKGAHMASIMIITYWIRN